ncbi:hypothetical protein C4585_01820 [Candidatus Parcubacteria bacterium]|nr:MAG: hypothetical protein C4585_01820 [Candidatus Parcubacteria bacterium]
MKLVVGLRGKKYSAILLLSATLYLFGGSLAFGDFEVPPIPDPNLKVTHAGIEIFNNQVPTPIVNGSELDGVNNNWDIHFIEPWDNPVAEGRAVFLLFRGTRSDGFENGDLPVENVNYSIETGSISGGTVFAAFSMPLLGDPDTPSGIYTLTVAEMPETKFVYEPDTDTFREDPYTASDYLEWILTWGGGVSPVAERTLTFEYVAGEASETFEECCSSVLFLPGLKGSVLKNGSDTLWPPSVWSDDVPQLALDEDGNSVNEVFVDGIVNTAYGVSIYEPFSDFVDGLVTEGAISEWLPFPYDWRFSPEDAVGNGVKTASGVQDIVAEVEDLAGQSQTGQVTIVAHSMGGLVGKALIKKLEEEGKDNLIDSFVMVGVPQLGTPQAAAALLHGDDEGLGYGFIARASEIRAVAQNMPGAYSLLPSPRYFEEVLAPVVTFSTLANFTEPWRNFWGTFINTYPDFSEFATGQGVARTEPLEDLLRVPEILRTDLVEEAEDFHVEYDAYEFPDHIRVVQVAGWGRPTVKEIEYVETHGFPSYKPQFTVEGDKTVVYPSAISSVENETYFFNLDLYRDSENRTSQHGDLLNTAPIQDFTTKVIKEDIVIETNLITSEKPQAVNIVDKLIVSTHSPVVLGAYDEFGNFTGIDPNQDLLADILSIKEDIPGSTFLYSAESQYIFVPKNGTYNFVYKGVGNGPTTVTVEEFSNEVVIPKSSYSDIPTTENTSATLVINATAPEEAVIELDIDGNGEIDEEVLADGTELTLEELIVLLKQKIQALDAKNKLKKNLLKKVDNIEKKIKKDKKKKAQKAVEVLGKKIYNKEMKRKIGSASAEEFLKLLEQIENAL